MIGRVMAPVLTVALALGISAPPASGQVGSPAGPVPVERLVERRAGLAKRLGDGVALLRSSDLRDIEGDYPQDSDYREDNDFFYLTGLEAPGGWLVLVARSGELTESVLYLPERDTAAERWTGPKLGPGPEAAALTGVGEVRGVARISGDLRSLLSGAGARGKLFVKGSDSRFCTRLETVRVDCRTLPGGGEVGGGDGVVQDLRPYLAAQRLVKDAEELQRLRRAIEITTEAQRAAMASVAPGLWEYELEALIEYTFRRRGAERVGFPSIVGSGPNSTILHYDKSRRQMQDGELVVVDIGAEYGYLTADVTRTIPVSGKFTPRQRALYDLVLGAQEAAIAAVRPGVTIEELTGIARAYMRNNSGDLCGPSSCERYFVHGLSHWLGMDVHDVGDYGTPLAAGMVLTIEPGIYIPDEAIGIRIEDDILVTATGAELLSTGAPRRAEDIEKLMAEGRRPLP